MTAAPVHFSRKILDSFPFHTKVRFAVACIITYLLFGWAGGAFGMPPVRGVDGSLLAQPAPIVSFLVAGVILLVGTLLGKLIVGNVYAEDGLFVGAMGMIALSYRAGPIRYVLFESDGPRVFPRLAGELVLLYAVVGIVWALMTTIVRMVKPAKRNPAVKEEYEPLATKLMATGTHVAVMVACMFFLAQSDSKTQALIAVGLSALLASIAACLTFPVRSSVWFWISPLLVGVLGYLLAYNNPMGFAIGYPQNAFGPLARALPLDYASAGIAGAIVGFWAAHQWRDAEMPQETPEDAPAVQSA